MQVKKVTKEVAKERQLRALWSVWTLTGACSSVSFVGLLACARETQTANRCALSVGVTIVLSRRTWVGNRCKNRIAVNESVHESQRKRKKKKALLK